ncbi:MinD/ParA family protein [Plantactinospora sp. GCM10030261]|uniref:MinD/ParA family ATP-binding protein n=1 Tax=Plantactinospora sp. GCM10030261 TaxID=3273420 RepID=UPI0036192F11
MSTTDQRDRATGPASPATGRAPGAPSLLRAVGAAVDPRLTARLRRIRRQDELLAGQLRRGHIAVLGFTPHTGGSTVTALLARICADLRGPRALAVDADPAGGLFHRLGGRPGGTAAEVLLALGIRTPAPGMPIRPGHRWLRRQLTVTQTGPLLLAGDPGAGPAPFTRPGEYAATLPRLRRWFPLLVVDTPKGAASPATWEIVTTADHVVVVGTPDPHSLDWLRQGIGWLVRSTGRSSAGRISCAIVDVRRDGGSAAAQRRSAHEAVRVPVVTIPYDRALARSGPLAWHLVGLETRRCARELAATVATALTIGPVR